MIYFSEQLPDQVNPVVSAIKVELIQQTNPLRVKILLYSILEQTWDHTNQEWTILKTYNLRHINYMTY